MVVLIRQRTVVGRNPARAKTRERGTMIDDRELGPKARLESKFVFTILGMKIVLFQACTRKTFILADVIILQWKLGNRALFWRKRIRYFARKMWFSDCLDSLVGSWKTTSLFTHGTESTKHLGASMRKRWLILDFSLVYWLIKSWKWRQ